MNLNEYNERIVKARIADLVEEQANFIMDTNNILEFFGYKPPTRKERIARWWIDKKQRCKDIWTILRGGNIHEDYGY